MITPKLSVRSVRSSWADLRVRMDSLSKARIRAGVFRGRRLTDRGVDLAIIATAHELGTSTVPARPFVAPTIRRYRREISDGVAAASKDAINDEDFTKRLRELGEWVVQRIRAEILDRNIPPPLAEKTVERKARAGAEDPDKPLVFSGDMVDAIESEVV